MVTSDNGPREPRGPPLPDPLRPPDVSPLSNLFWHPLFAAPEDAVYATIDFFGVETERRKGGAVGGRDMVADKQLLKNASGA